MTRYRVQTKRIELRVYFLDADSVEQAEERALEGYVLPDETVKLDEYITHPAKAQP